MASLEKLHDYLFCGDRKCFKDLMEHSESIIGLLRAEDIVRKCENLDRMSKGVRNNMNTAWPSSHEIDSNQSNYLQTRDEILCRLSLVWDLFHVLESKGIKNLCPSLHSFCQLFCEQGHMFQMLVTCLSSDNHFIAFQAHKVIREIAKTFSEIVVRGPLSELILSCLSKNKTMWSVLYTIEIIKHLLSFKTNQESCDPKQERLQGCLGNCDCIFKESNLLTVNVESVWNIVRQYWPALSKLCLDGVILLSNEIESEVRPNMQCRKAISQQILASFVSLGSILVQSCYHPTMGLSQRVHFLTSLEHGVLGTVEDVNAPMFHSVEQNCTETQKNFSKNIGGHEVILSIFKSLQENVEKLVEIDKQEFSLHLRRAIMQFFNDVIDVAQQNSLNFFQRKSRHDIPDHVASLCSFLLKNIDKLFWSLPKVSPGVYFGGQDFKNKETKHSNLACDKVITRKVLLLVLKSALIILHAQKKSKSSNWKLLKDSIESWLNIVAKAIPESNERHRHVDDNDMIADSVVVLFADQDDELMAVLQYILNLYQELFLGEGLLPITQWTKKLRKCFSPHKFFLKFLHSFHYDHSLLLDFLISNETCFLPYFSSYLRYMANDWNGFVEIAKELHFLSTKSFQPLGPEYRNTATKVAPTSREPLRKNVFTNKTLFSENHPVAFLDLGEKYSNDITFLDREIRVEWSSEKDLNNPQEVEVSVSNNSTSSALLSIMDDYADLSSGDNEDDEGDFNEKEDKEDDVPEVDRVPDDQVFKYHERYNINHQEDCGDVCNDDEEVDDDEDHEEVHDCDEDRDEDHDEDHDEDRDEDNDCDEDRDEDRDEDNDCDEDHDEDHEEVHDEDRDEDNDCDEDHDEDDHDRDKDHGEDHDCDEGHGCDDHDGDEDIYCGENHNEDHNGDLNEDHHRNMQQEGCTDDCDKDDCDKDDCDKDDCDKDDCDKDVDHLRNSLSCLIRLRFSIERMASKQLFPYPVQSLVRLIKYIECLYEGD